MANCNRQQLNITCGTDVVLHDRLIFEGETFDPNLSVGIAANLVSSLGKRTALDVQVVDDELLISVPWIDGTLPGCYGLEVTGSCNSKKWATYADSLIRYTKATRPGASEVTVESDTYDITQEVGYMYSNSPVTFAEVTVDDGYGTPSVDVEYEQRVLSMAFHNLKGNGITDIDVDEQVGDEAVNTVTIKTDADQEGTEFKVRNGRRGNGIASSSEVLSDQDGGTNMFTITDDDGTVHEFHSKNGTKGSQGDSAVYNPDDPDAPDFVMANTTGQSTTKAMTQKAVTDELDEINITGELVDLNSVFTIENLVVYQDVWFKINGSLSKHLCTSPGKKYKITADASLMAKICFLDEFNTPVQNEAAVPVETITINAGATQVVTVPLGAYHIVFNDNSGWTGGTGNQKLPSEVIEYKSDSIRDTLSWAIDPFSKNSLIKEEVLAEYGYADCPYHKNMYIDGSLTNADFGYTTSEWIAIPQGTTHIIYDGITANYQNLQCGIIVCDSEKTMLWYDTRTNGPVSGTVMLSEYPQARYVRFMGALKQIDCSVKFVKQYINDFSVVNEVVHGSDIKRTYGCTTEGTTTNVSESIMYFGSLTPCLADGDLELVYGKFSDSGMAKFAIGFVDQNNYFIVRDSFALPVVAGLQTINVKHLGKTIKKNEYLMIDCHAGNVLPYFGVNESVTPQAFCVTYDGQYFEFSGAVYLNLAYVINSHKMSQSETQAKLDDVENAVDINTDAISELQNNKKIFVTDSVTGINYQLVINNGVLGITPIQFVKAAVLGNSITNHEITDIWWGEWGMAATKREYDMVHIIEEGLQAKDPNAEVVPIPMAPWERDFSLDLATLIGDNITSETDFVVIRLGENVPNANVSEFQTALGNLIDYIYSISPNAKVVITGVFWANSSKENAIKAAAQAKGIDYIKIDQFGIAYYEEEQGHYVYGDDDAIHAINNHGVEIHPSNKGMLAIANTILNAIGYAPVNKSYSLQEVTVGGVTGTMYVED